MWEHGEESLMLFVEKISSIDPTIKLSADCSYSLLNFLDLKVVSKGGKIVTDLNLQTFINTKVTLY